MWGLTVAVHWLMWTGRYWCIMFFFFFFSPPLYKMTSLLWSWWHYIVQCSFQGDCWKTQQNINLIYYTHSCEVANLRWVAGGRGGRGTQMCMCLRRSRGRVLGEGIRSIVLPLPSSGDWGSHLTASRWKDQNKKPPFFYPLSFCGGRENPSVSLHCVGWVWLFVSAGWGGVAGGRQADSVNAYHDHNRANKHSSAMKAQRERLRIPGLTLEWVFSSVTLWVAAPPQCVASPVFVMIFTVFHCCLELCAALALAAAAFAAGSLSCPLQRGNSGCLVLVSVLLHLFLCTYVW